jgi:hypothetical protein
MKKILLGITAFCYFSSISHKAISQTGNENLNNAVCGTGVPSQQWESRFQEAIQEILKSSSNNKTQAQVYTIPVIIHVVHGGQSVGTYPNLAQGQLNSQIQVLNNDFGGIGFNSGNYPQNAFLTFAASQSISPANLDAFGRIQIANCNVQFCLATKDTLGNILAEPGIERINYVNKGWTNPASFNTNTSLQNYVNATIKPQSIWNVSKYLNIWVTDVGSNATLLGYATFPPLTNLAGFPNGFFGTSTTDGFWCLARAFGSQAIFPNGTYMQGYTRGRTSTHEIGHYLGLRHTWGDATCATDYCTDTPPNKASNFGSPSYPLNATGTNSCAGADNGSMFMNFMDYTDDPAKYMFTTDQATRIQAAMASSPYRKFLGTHNLCSVASVAAVSQFSLPATVCGNASLTLVNSSIGTPVPNYTWTSTGGATFNPNNNSVIASINFPGPGTYTITLAAGNGTVSSTTKTITVYPTPPLVLNTPTLVCLNDLVTITASGGNTYAWLPFFTLGTSVSYTASVDQSFTCTATDTHGCKSIDSVTIYVTECLGVDKIKTNPNHISLYPNPSADKLFVKLFTDKGMDVTIEIYDASGRMLFNTPANFGKDKTEMPLDVAGFAKGIYLVKIISNTGLENHLKFIKE